MRILYPIYLLFFFSLALQAEEAINERVFVHTDKNCYVAGEEILVKFYTINRRFQPSTLSKTGYVEICDTEKPQMQLKLVLENGSGSGKIKIPSNIPSGIYQLSGYTRYMRNEGESVFFRRQIAIINAGTHPDPGRVKRTDPDTHPWKKTDSDPTGIKIKTDRNVYSNREAVQLVLENIPENASDLVVSVSRNDSIVSIPGVDYQSWLKQVKDPPVIPVDPKWLPEYEGHIITGRLVSRHEEKNLLSGIAFVGKTIHYQNGQVDPDGETVYFYTDNVFGPQEVVTSVTSNLLEKVPYRMDIVSPFYEVLPMQLPVLEVYPVDNQLMDRYIGAQLLQASGVDTLLHQFIPGSDHYMQPSLSYDLDEYRRFSTLGETFIEFIYRIRVSKMNGEKRIKVYSLETERYNTGNTLVLLDGIPVFNHEDVLNYDPQNIRKVNIYDGRYVFGGLVFDCMVSFITHRANLPFFKLSEESQLIEYECPFLPVAFNVPDYSDNAVKKSRKPDFRHTLYWNPSIESGQGKPVDLHFYTSDLRGEFKVTVEGITTDGKMIYGTSYFEVK